MNVCVQRMVKGCTPEKCGLHEPQGHEMPGSTLQAVSHTQRSKYMGHAHLRLGGACCSGLAASCSTSEVRRVSDARSGRMRTRSHSLPAAGARRTHSWAHSSSACHPTEIPHVQPSASPLICPPTCAVGQGGRVIPPPALLPALGLCGARAQAQALAGAGPPPRDSQVREALRRGHTQQRKNGSQVKEVRA